MSGLIDTHCHLDAAEFEADREAVLAQAGAAGLTTLVVPAVDRRSFDDVAALAKRSGVCVYALGIHPLFVEAVGADDLDVLAQRLDGNTDVVAVGEIGLDFFVADVDRARQLEVFTAQLRLARDHDLPVILHVRRAVDEVLTQLRRFGVRGGIAHAFNGSAQQADAFLKLGFALGFGGAMTWPRALRIRGLAATLPPEAIVLETDAPDIPPQWVGRGRNSPLELPRIADVLAELRGVERVDVAAQTTANARRVLPRLARPGA